ncbi:hypothetical protein [Jannaschia rubra]|uniref:Uncharacterized protein n=1 Tax=Jannaschia rubra TaxID=282197 RepID=A0A0M6XU71_9RHOB|nr:hypothetical protein [Jannaschia rubra]CTQ33761.1 hypothetical protein JAN5088_02547 [Jannaschia rubra]SFG08370.1 hypothetical protein SAMN04488517_102596 [Jannaschia rubra]
MTRCAFAIVAAGLVAGCVPSPENYETAPVTVPTEAGNVVCQLYTPRRVVWDRSIDRPASMSVGQADAICKAEGERQKAAR